MYNARPLFVIFGNYWYFRDFRNEPCGAGPIAILQKDFWLHPFDIHKEQ